MDEDTSWVVMSKPIEEKKKHRENRKHHEEPGRKHFKLRLN